ncbi:uncharacterized protein LOC111404764 [Olea europaea var. sylvestris]|uniref:uncharacterized protein LOC111404764 n=1 Tax=Olea europaea var. sylvestris TaxID=158386 RepID=UPI000C1CF276|nr:uncharacterized protein LOC111404764 [Olea europaea var. sylvestris]
MVERSLSMREFKAPFGSDIVTFWRKQNYPFSSSTWYQPDRSSSSCVLMAAETNTPPLAPNSSPHLLHPSDSPNLILVYGLLTGDNYPKWQRAISRALNTKNKLCFVDGTLQNPTADSPTYSQWSQTKDMILTWLLNTIKPSIVNSLEYHTNPRDQWRDLQSCFSHGNNIQLYHLKRDLYNLTQNTQPIHDYYNQIKQIWDELGDLQNVMDLAEMKKKKAKDELVFQFLLELNDSYSSLRTQILALDPLPSMQEVFSTLFQEEQQRLLHVRTVSPTPNIVAMTARTPVQNRTPLKCTECGRNGHRRERCWVIIGYPPRREPKNRQSSILGRPPVAAVTQTTVASASDSSSIQTLPSEL